MGEGVEAGVPEQGHSSLSRHLLVRPKGTQDPDLAGEGPSVPPFKAL